MSQGNIRAASAILHTSITSGEVHFNPFRLTETELQILY